MSKIKCLIGGGAGLIGSHLSRYLLNKGYKVIILDDLSESFCSNIDQRCTFYQIDCGNSDNVNEVFEREKPDFVYNAQAHAAEILSPYCSVDNYRNNLLSVVTLKNACVNFNIKKQIIFSSLAIYGHQKELPFTEKTPPLPEDNYGISKLACELDAKMAKKHFSLDYSIVRPYNFQGPFVNFSSLYRNFIGIAIRQILNNENITVFSDGEQTRSFTDVRYLCEPLEKLLYNNCETVNIGSSRPYKIIDVAKIIQGIGEKHGMHSKISHLPPREEAVHAYCSNELAQEKLDFIDNTDIEKLCNDTFDWIRKQPKRHTKKAKYEITKNLPPSWI